MLSTNFTTHAALAHRDALLQDAAHERLVREARAASALARSGNRRPARRRHYVRRLVALLAT